MRWGWGWPVPDERFSLEIIPAVDLDLRKSRLDGLARAARKAAAGVTLEVLNLGAGVQSTTILQMDSLVHRQGRRSVVEGFLGEPYPFPPLDAAVFADTQDEPVEVYEHLDRLGSMDVAPIYKTTAGCLDDDLMRGRNSTGQRFASIPAFTSAVPGKKGGILKRQCTAEYKVEPVERLIRRQLLGLDPGQPAPAGVVVRQWFGLSFDEPSRIAKVRARVEAKHWALPLFPLADLVLERCDCEKFLASVGLVVPRSACVYCPFKRNVEWVRLRDGDPTGWARAVLVDRALRVEGTVCNRNLDQHLYVHPSCLPLDEAPIDEADVFDFLAYECEGMCGV